MSLGTSPRSLRTGRVPLVRASERDGHDSPSGRALSPLFENEGRSVRWAPQTSRQGNVPLSNLVFRVLPGLASSGHPGQATCPQYPRDGPCALRGTPRQSCVSRLRSRDKVMSPPQHTVFPGQDCRTLRPRDVDVSQLRLQGRAGCLPRHTPHPAPHTATSSETGPHGLTRALLKAAFFSWVLDMRPCHM